jgi:transposase
MYADAFFSQLLGLEAPFRLAEIRHLDTEENHPIELVVEVDPRHRPLDGYGQPCTLHSYYERRWRHLDVMQYPCYIRCRVPRYRTSRGTIETLKVPWAREGSRFTVLFEALAMHWIEETHNVEAVARRLGVYAQRLWKVFDHYTGQALSARQRAAARRIGLDETSRRKGHEYITLFVNMDTAEILDIQDGKDASTIERFVAGYDHDEAIEAISMDMSPAFIKGVAEHLPEAEPTYDRFHVVRLIKRKVKELERRLKASQADAPGYFRRWFARLYEQTNPAEMAALLAFLIDLALEQGLKKIAQSLKGHFDGIVAYARTGLTNGLLEGINTKIQLIKRTARGYKDTETFKRMIYLCFGCLELSFEQTVTNKNH